MKKVLLAVVGGKPDQKTFTYASQLSRQIEAELDVLQVVRSPSPDIPGFLKKPDVRYQQTTCASNPNAEVVNYINKNRDVVFAIYDTPSGSRRKRKKVPKDIKKLSVPLVIVRS
jgi:hypothetical protein